MSGELPEKTILNGPAIAPVPNVYEICTTDGRIADLVCTNWRKLATPPGTNPVDAGRPGTITSLVRPVPWSQVLTTLPQAPQFFGSLRMSVQTLPHAVSGHGSQRPEVQISVLPQALPHSPQFAGSTCRSL